MDRIAFIFRFRGGVAVTELEVIAEITSILVENPVRLWFPALIVNSHIMETAIETAPEISLAERAKILSADHFID